MIKRERVRNCDKTEREKEREREREREREERWDFRRLKWSRWKTVPQTSGCNRKRYVADARQPSMSDDRRDGTQSVSAGRRSSDRVVIGTPEQRPCRKSAQDSGALSQ